jgi:hypothetical protein
MQLPAEGAAGREISEFVDLCLTELSLDEKIYMMSGHGFIDQYLADDAQYNFSPYQCGGGNERLGLPKLMFTDGPRGACAGIELLRRPRSRGQIGRAGDRARGLDGTPGRLADIRRRFDSCAGRIRYPTGTAGLIARRRGAFRVLFRWLGAGDKEKAAQLALRRPFQ